MTTPLSFPAQLNAIRVLTELAHTSAMEGNKAEAVQLLNRAQERIVQVVRSVDVGSGVVPAASDVRGVSDAPAHDKLQLLDEIAVGQLGRRYMKATEAQRKVIRELAKKVTGEDYDEIENDSVVRGERRLLHQQGKTARTGVGRGEKVRKVGLSGIKERASDGTATTTQFTTATERKQISWHDWLRGKR